jgi:hypothetical protein
MMEETMDYNFKSVSLKVDVYVQLKAICDDAKRYGIFISYSDFLRVCVFNKTIIEFVVNEINKSKNGDFDFSGPDQHP